MPIWLQNHIGTIAVLAVLMLLFGVMIACMIKNKKAGKGSCGCGCADCALRGQCHGQTAKPNDKTS